MNLRAYDLKFGFQKMFGECCYTNGAGETTISPLLYLIDSIDISSFFKETLFEKTSQIYHSGLSLAQISQTLLIPKSTVRDTLVEGGLALRPNTSGMSKSDIGAPTYGYVRIDGKILKDPREQKLIRLMISYWQSGMSFNAIAKKFNCQKIKPRTAKEWNNGTIRKIILRTISEQGKTK